MIRTATIELISVFVILQIFFGYFEYQYKPDIFYVLGRLLTARKYIIPSIVLPFVFVILHLLVRFLFF